MKVYILLGDFYYDSSIILGVYSKLNLAEIAKESYKNDFDEVTIHNFKIDDKNEI